RFLLRDHRQEPLKDIPTPHLLHPGLVRTQLRIDGKPCRSRLRSQQVTVTPVGGDPQYLLQLLQSQPRYPFELRRQCLQVRRCYLHHRFLLHDHRQTYRWIAPIAFERLLAPTHQPRPPPFATVLRTKALSHLHGYWLAVVCCRGARERRHWHRFCQYSATSRAWGSVIFASPSDSALPRDVDWQVLDARLLNWLRVELHQSQYLLRHTHFD